jgi:5-methylcytosine-specific restriction endonuclease McrA
MTAKTFRSSYSWKQACKRVLQGSSVCALCGLAIDRDARPRTRWAPSIDHVWPLRYIDLNTPDGIRLALDPSNLRLSHVGCNARRSNKARRAGSPVEQSFKPIRSSREW